MQELSRELSSIGLSDKEADVYLASLSLGASSVQNIAKKSGVNRVTTYVIIEQLTQKGLLSTTSKGKKKLYVAERPERLLSLIHQREKELKDHASRFDQLLPELKSIMAAAGDKPVVRFYEGLEGFKSIHQDLLSRKITEYSEVVIPSLSDKAFPEGSSPARDEVHKRIMSQDMRVRIISIGEYSNEDKFEKIPNHEVRHLSKEQFPFSMEFGVYGSVVVMYLVKGEHIAVVIDDKQLANNFQILFNVCWGAATPDYQG